MVEPRRVGAQTRPLQLLIVSFDQQLLKTLIMAAGASEALALCGWISTVDELSGPAGRLPPDITLIDFDMPLWASMGAVDQVLERWPDSQIMAVFSPGKTGDALNAVLAGANACLVKERQPPAQLNEALCGLAAGTSPLSPEIARLLVNALRRTQ